MEINKEFEKPKIDLPYRSYNFNISIYHSLFMDLL